MKYLGLLLVVGVLILSGCGVDVQEYEEPTNQSPTTNQAPPQVPTPTDAFDGVDVEEYVREWIQESPTYQSSGSNLALQEYVVLESYPASHALVFTFDSTSDQYGSTSSSGQQVTRQIVIRAFNGEITSAIIDQTYDEITQEYIDEEPTSFMTLRFNPEQCEQEVWNQWYEQGNIQYIQEPTQVQLITDYYASQGIYAQVDEYDLGMATCSACGCPTTYYYEAEVLESDIDILFEDGWVTT